MALDRFSPFDRVPPHSLDAEQAVLGSMLIERPAVEKAAETLKPEDFYRDAHRYIYEAMMALAERDEPIDLITLEDELRASDRLEIVGGHLYLINLMDAPATAANIEYYAHIVEEKAILRRLMDAGTQIQGLAHSEFEEVGDLVDRAERIIFEIGQRRMGQFFYAIRPLLDEELDRIEKRFENKGVLTGRMTPFSDLNHMTSGLQPSDLIIVAARPGMGKSTLSVQLAQFIALSEKIPVAIFSLEMSKEQLVTRMICSEAKVDSWRLRTGMLQNDDWHRVGDAISRLAEAPIYIDDTPDVSAMEMRTKCRRLQSEKGLGLILIDYLQLMRSHKKTENRNQEISEIARACKGLARELKVPVVALSQLSRAVESRPDKRPMLSDLRECVIGSTRLIDANTGRAVPICEVRPGNNVLGVGKDQRIGVHAVKDVWSTGIKPVWKLTTRTGRTITATGNHPFLTATGWKPLEQLQTGDVIGTALRLPEHGMEIDGRDRLCEWLESTVLWEEITSIEPAGEQEVFDICIPGCGNFVANGIVAHNSGSIEAEADIVMFIYREAYYKMKEAGEGGEGDGQSPNDADGNRPEETELILAKHRSGPTGKVKVGFIKQYTVFVDIDRTHGDDDDG